MADDVFNHHHRAVDDHAEIQSAQRKEIRRNVPQVQTNGGKEQRKGYGQRDNDCRARIAEKQEKNNYHQNHSLDEVVHDRVGRVVNEIVAIQIRNDLHTPWQDEVVQPFDHGMDSFERGGRVRTLAHEHNPFDHIVVIDHESVSPVNGLSNLAQADLRTLGYNSYVFQPQGRAVLCFEDGLFDILDIANQSHRANVGLLRALFDTTSAGVRVAVRQLLLDLHKTQSVRHQLVGIDSHLILASDAAEGRIVHNVRHRLYVFGDDPILNGLELHHVIGGICALQGVPIDRADGTEIRTDACREAGRQCYLP